MTFRNFIFKRALISFCMMTSINSLFAQSTNHETVLSKKQRSIVAIAAYTGKGDLERLKPALAEGLEAGMAINEIKGILVQMYAYCGFPRSLNALNSFMAVVDERKEQGKKDLPGDAPEPLPPGTNMAEYGERVRTELVGRPVTGKLYEFCPEIDEYLRSHLFGDIFSHNNLDYHSRELATVSALAAMEMEAQLSSHLSICRNLNFTEAQLHDFASIIGAKIGHAQGNAANRAINLQFKSDTTMSGNEQGVVMQRVAFPNRNTTIAGNLYLPAGIDMNKRYAAIIVGHPAGGVKEQTAGTYARNLARQGFVTLAFDASYQGESGGEPRGLEDPAVRTEDFRCAADYLSTLPYVNNIGALGICGGGGFAIAAAITDHRIKAVAGISAVDLGQLRRNGMNGSLRSTIQQRLESAATQRVAEANGGQMKYANYVPDSLDEIKVGAPAMYREGYEYYRTPLAQHPRSTNKYLFSSLDKLIAFTAFDNLELLAPRPLLMIAGSKADSFYFSEDAYRRAQEPKELYVVDGASHIQLYWKPEYVEIVTQKLSEYFTEYLRNE